MKIIIRPDRFEKLNIIPHSSKAWKCESQFQATGHMALFLCAHTTSSSHKCRGKVEEVFGSTFYKNINPTWSELTLISFNLAHVLRAHTNKHRHTGRNGFHTWVLWEHNHLPAAYTIWWGQRTLKKVSCVFFLDTVFNIDAEPASARCYLLCQAVEEKDHHPAEVNQQIPHEIGSYNNQRCWRDKTSEERMWLQHGDLLVGQCFLNLQVMTTLKAAYHTFCTLDIHIMIPGSSKGTVRDQHWDFNWHQDKYAYGFEWRYILETSWMTSFGRKRNFWSVELGRI